MTRDNIEDYLYFFWAPLLKEGAVAVEEIDDFEKMIILTLSQGSVYIEAPNYKAGSSREFADDIKNEITGLTNKIVAGMPARTLDDSYWLKITISDFLPAGIGFADTHLEVEQSFGPFKIQEDKFISFEFYYLAHQLQLQLPATAEISGEKFRQFKKQLKDEFSTDGLVTCERDYHKRRSSVATSKINFVRQLLDFKDDK